MAESDTHNTSEEILVKERKEKLFRYFKNNWNLVSYVILAFLVYWAVKIRTLNLSGLKDITTGGWTLGPDLDPFLFLRWAQEITTNGQLMAADMMRYVPLGFNTEKELWLHPFMIAMFHKVAAFFGSQSITESAILYPAFMFGFAMIAFFFMIREAFSDSFGVKKSNILALIATFFLSIFPALLPRTVAGIPEKEAGSLPFMFLTFYFFMKAWKSDKPLSIYLYAALAGFSTAIMALIWGGFVYVTMTIGLVMLAAYIFEKIDSKKIILYLIWFAAYFAVNLSLTQRYDLKDLLTSINLVPALLALAYIITDWVLHSKPLRKHKNKLDKYRLPRPILSAIIGSIALVLISSLIFGVGFIPSKIISLKNSLVTPISDRLGVTVAENRQPFFTEWASSFGPYIGGFAITFWIMIFGAVWLMYFSLKEFKKDRGKITSAFAFFLGSLVFSRYSSASQLNGTNFTSLAFYALGPLVLIGTLGYYYFRDYKQDNEKMKFSRIDFGLILILSFFVISLISARSAVRLIMMLVPAASIMMGYVCVETVGRAVATKDNKSWKFVFMALAGAVILLGLMSAQQFYTETKATVQSYVPSIYTQQWQKAMAWVRNETPQNAVFGHWWDYGYWLQSIGERATVLDGGNAIPYWNHMMGRYTLAGSNETEAIEFLYAHNTTHFLIDSTDIGKYSAFSSIGSNQNYDLASYIPAFVRDLSQTQEKKNSSVYVYPAGIGLDEDLTYDANGSKIFLPVGQAGLAAVLVERGQNNTLVSQPIGVFAYQGVPYNLPLRYAYTDKGLIDYGSGIEAGIFFMPRVNQQGNNIQIEQDGAMFYLSRRVVNSQLARLYIYKDQKDPYFKLVHSEDDFVVASLKQQGAEIDNDLVYYQGVRGPIRIWEIKYPKNIKFKEEYLSVDYPQELMRA